jgi:hypothetical protein
LGSDIASIAKRLVFPNRMILHLVVTEARLPVARLAAEWRNGDHYNFGLSVEVDKRELELAINDTPGLVLV